MGYYSTVSGEITFAPPLTWAEIQAAENPNTSLFALRIDEEQEDTPGGVFVRKTASTIYPRYREEVKAYTVEADLEAVLRVTPGRTFVGEFRVTGADGDVQRAFIEDGRVVVWDAVLLWPDGS